MEAFKVKEVKDFFARCETVFADEKEALITLDSKVGDSDLGLTMAKGFAAANAVVQESEAETVDALFKQAGAAIARAAPSTMGTLMATGFLRGASAVSGSDTLGTKEIAAFWTAFRDGVAHRGRAVVGDKTVLDVLHPVAVAITEQSDAGTSLDVALLKAAEVAREALEATKSMVAQHGKAAAFQEQTIGIQDAGSTVAVYLIATMADTAA